MDEDQNTLFGLPVVSSDQLPKGDVTIGSFNEYGHIKITYPLLDAIATAGDIAKKLGKLMYVCQKVDHILITHKRPDNRKEIIAKCYPGGRRQFLWPLED